MPTPHSLPSARAQRCGCRGAERWGQGGSCVCLPGGGPNEGKGSLPVASSGGFSEASQRLLRGSGPNGRPEELSVAFRGTLARWVISGSGGRSDARLVPGPTPSSLPCRAIRCQDQCGAGRSGGVSPMALPCAALLPANGPEHQGWKGGMQRGTVRGEDPRLAFRDAASPALLPEDSGDSRPIHLLPGDPRQ